MNKQELRDYIQSLPPLYGKGNRWLERRIELRDYILNDDPDDLLYWPPIHSSMQIPYRLQHRHLDSWEQHTDLKIADLKTIAEFGGGYGAMLKCLRERGFSGSYSGYDFPEMLAIQRYYTQEDFSKATEGTYDLLISICALSEASIFDRIIFLRDNIFTHCLIRYQEQWDGIDNHAYFSPMRGDKMFVTGESYTDHWYLIR